MIQAAVGISQNITDHAGAGKEAATRALEGLGDKGKPNILFCFSSIQYNQEHVLSGAREVTKDIPLAGGSAAGEITSFTTVFDGVVVMAIASDQMRFSIGSASGVATDSFRAGAEAAKDVLSRSKEPLKLFIMLPDGMTGNGAAIVEGVQSVLGKNFPIIGGSTGDDYRFEKTYEYVDDRLLTDSVVGIGVSGDFSYGFGIKHGWQPVGLPMKVTKATGTLLQEVDGKPALAIYQEYFGKEASELVREPLARMAYTYPIGQKVEGSDELLIRDPVVANEKGEITMASAIPQGTMIHLMIGDRDKAIQAAKDAANHAVEELAGHAPKFVLMFNCMARNKLLGVRCSEENESVQEIVSRDIPSGIPMIGFYTYGEQGPLLGKKGTPAFFHNETMTLLVVGE